MSKIDLGLPENDFKLIDLMLDCMEELNTFSDDKALIRDHMRQNQNQIEKLFNHYSQLTTEAKNHLKCEEYLKQADKDLYEFLLNDDQSKAFESLLNEFIKKHDTFEM